MFRNHWLMLLFSACFTFGLSGCDVGVQDTGEPHEVDHDIDVVPVPDADVVPPAPDNDQPDVDIDIGGGADGPDLPAPAGTEN